MPQLDFNLIFINFLTVIIFFIIFYLFNYFFVMKKVFSVFMMRKFVVLRTANHINNVAVVKKTNNSILHDIQIETIKLVKKTN